MIQESLLKIANEYLDAKEKPLRAHPLQKFINREIKDSFQQSINLTETNLFIKASAGQGAWAEVPWIALLDSIVTDTMQKGYYIVYLFSADMRERYLCMGQGVTTVKEELKKNWQDILHQRANLMRIRVPEYKEAFDSAHIDLKSSSPLAKAYAEGSAFYKSYKVSNMPNEEILLKDLDRMMSLYNKLIFLGGTDLLEDFSIENKTNIEEPLFETKKYKLHLRIEGRG